MRIALFEDAAATQFLPLTWLRPVFELLCGHFTPRERALRTLSITEWGAFLRPDLAASYAETHPEAQLNRPGWLGEGQTLLLNGRWLADPAALAGCSIDAAGLIDGEVAWLFVEPWEAPVFQAEEFDTAVAQLARTRRRVKASGRLAAYPWDLVAHNGTQLTADFRSRRRGISAAVPAGTAIVGPAADVHIEPTASLDPYVVIDSRKGPVYIDAGAVVQAFTRIEGPCYIGRQSQLFRTNLREGTSIGPVCRVGGEVEGAILHGYVNKYHDGFLGHGYVGPWCNLGALTTNSDLKNDYSAVKVPLLGDAIDTGETKVGCFLGDHTKTAIGSCFNTGTAAGIMCQILPAGELLPKHIPSFSRLWHGELTDGGLEQGLTTARIAMGRRGVELTQAMERLIRHVHQQTAAERDRAIQKQAERREGAIAGKIG
jgi:UDP-N-acetylglucosamine diphosphorylase/glucosamine-1-phosphate N-acetyltransferase